jgi:hypothetical protein
MQYIFDVISIFFSHYHCQCDRFPNAHLGQCKWHLLDMGFKRLVSGIKESNRKGSLQIAYCWIKSWMYGLETPEELNESVNQFYNWLRSPEVTEELGDDLSKNQEARCVHEE